METIFCWTIVQVTWFFYVAAGLAFGIAFFVLCWNIARIRKILEKMGEKKD